MTKVLVSGANGYIAVHTVLQLIEKGYTVVGTFRTEDKAELWKSRFGDKFETAVVPDFLVQDAFDHVLKDHPDVEYFLHTASPVIFNAKDRKKDVIDPAILGTTSALKAAHKYGKNIKHFVYTSSGAALYNSSKIEPGLIVNEQLWNGITLEDALQNDRATYAASKTFAEKVAWDFIAKEKPQFTLTTVNPVFVFGPQAYDEDAKGTLNYSAGIVELVLRLGKNDPIPDIKGGAVDVRDVAKVHIEAFEKPETYGKRLIAKELFYNAQSILDFIRKNFPESADQLPMGNPGSAVEEAKDFVVIDNVATTQLLHIHWIPIEKMIVDSVKQIFKENVEV